ncbi:recombination protein [Olleya phage Harreka_1]|uniref:Protein ninG n=1 Tax=Olleya phage Harreka_1 TaxID=2745673 RepID=A0A8E4ZLQ5_9CAUD|nr:NinG/ Rap DNA junction specific endonuclease [Olleya phage Harreka_1]QQV90440.1 recombination protein [Olleya phage Harreka_1]
MARQPKCRNCKKQFTKTYSTTQTCCSPKCALEDVRKKKEADKISLKDAKLEKVKKDTLQSLKNTVQKVCHEFIRLRDKFKPCISCNAQWNKDFQAGHFYKAELYSNIKFNETNISGQCRKCNLRKDGNYDGYKKGFIERYGIEEFNKLDALAMGYKHEDFKWDREVLKEQRKYFTNKLKKLG